MGQDYYRTMQNGGRQSAAASREMRRALAEVTDQINTAKSSALNMAGAFAGLLLPVILFLSPMSGIQ